MQLTGKQIVENDIVLGVCQEGIQQQGVDLRVKNISKVEGEPYSGLIRAKGKTELPFTSRIYLEEDSVDHVNRYHLMPGYYEVEFMEGCNLKSNTTLHIKSRSSMVRCGALCFSGQFDAGFKTKNMGCFMQVNIPIYIEPEARIAQALVFESYPVNDEDLYNGQWQNDKQRNN